MNVVVCNKPGSGPIGQDRSRVVVCRCRDARTLDAGTLDGVLGALRERRNVEITVVDDLCGLAAETARLAEAIAGRGPVVVVACRSRAIRWLLRFAAVSDGCVLAVGIRSLRAEEAARLVNQALETLALSKAPDGDEGVSDRTRALGAAAPASTKASDSAAGEAVETAWAPWFPVIDYNRCSGCGKCLDFCPFGVFARDDGRTVRVTNPRNCKFNCPACARICPRLAIIFPKHDGRPIDGDEVQPSDLDALPDRDLCEKLKHENIHDLLARRGGPRAGRRPEALS